MKFEMAEVMVEKFDIVDVITTSNEQPTHENMGDLL